MYSSMPHIIYIMYYIRIMCHMYIVLLLYCVCCSCVCVLDISVYWCVICVLSVMYVLHILCIMCMYHMYCVYVCAHVCTCAACSDCHPSLQGPVGPARLAGFRAASSVPGLRTVALGIAMFLGTGACPCVGPRRGAGQGGAWPYLAGTGSPCVGGARQQPRRLRQQQ